MIRQLTVDFNRVVRDDLIRGNARRVAPGTDLSIGATVIVGDDDWGVAPAEIVESDSLGRPHGRVALADSTGQRWQP